MAKRARVRQAFLPTLQPDAAPLMVLPSHVLNAEKPSLDLPDDEMETLIRALDPARVSFALGSGAKRIAASICKAEIGALSIRQRNAAIRIAWRYRRQMPIAVRILLARFKPETLK